MFDKDYDELNTECKNIYDYEETNESEEPKLYEFRNFVANNKFNYNKKFILNIIKMTSINALRYFKNIITINLENNDDKKPQQNQFPGSGQSRPPLFAVS